MSVEEMLRDVSVLRSECAPGLAPAGVAYDSRQVRPGDVFVAARGLKADGMAFVPQAAAAGASMIVVGRGRMEEARRLLATAPRGGEVGVVEVADERAALAHLGRNAAGRPDLEMSVTGITGTNGKTTTAYLLAAMWEAAGKRCGLLGTVEYRLGGRILRAERTTPESPEIHRHMRTMSEAGAAACVMEVSSHALDLRRTEGIRFAAAVFTNLTRDHLDYHRDMEAYFSAKRRLFEGLVGAAPSILNADDPYGRRLAREVARRPVLYGEAEDAEYRLVRREGSMDGLRLTIEAEGSRHEIVSPLVGRPNACNLLAAAAAARAAGLSWEAIREGAAGMSRVRGRLERVECGQPFAVVVDYAHTDDALRNVLEALRPLTSGRLITVFGCGGDRDRTKRPLMGAHAARLSDAAWVTSDNPRTEDPMAIIGMILEGVRGVPGGEARCRVEPDRRKAIAAAIAGARAGDTVLIAGKGHETHQILADRTIPFDDVEVARGCLVETSEPGGGDAGGDTP